MNNLQTILLKYIKVGKRFRKEHDVDDTFVNSIREKGIIQPITLNQNLELMAGGRRYLGSILAGKKDIPALIRDTSDELDLREIELMENMNRKEMRWDEKVALVKRIHNLYLEKDPTWNGRKTAEAINKSIGGVSDALSMANSLEQIPDLSKAKTEKDAKKVIERITKKEIVKTLRKEQEKRMEITGKSQIALASRDFQIGDAFEELQGLIDMYKDMNTISSIKFMEVDPPYAVDIQSTRKSTTIRDGKEMDEYNEIDKEEYPTFLAKLCPLLYKLMSSDSWCIFWFGEAWQAHVSTALQDAGFKIGLPAIWVKNRGQTNRPNLLLANCYEAFFPCRKGNPTLHSPGHSNVFQYPTISNRYHPTQRPIELMEDILQTFALPGDIVCIPFLGSGATLKAVYKQNMNGFGWDLNQYNKDQFLLTLEEDVKDE